MLHNGGRRKYVRNLVDPLEFLMISCPTVTLNGQDKNSGPVENIVIMAQTPQGGVSGSPHQGGHDREGSRREQGGVTIAIQEEDEEH